jgi:hypothetical protein
VSRPADLHSSFHSAFLIRPGLRRLKRKPLAASQTRVEDKPLRAGGFDLARGVALEGTNDGIKSNEEFLWA